MKGLITGGSGTLGTELKKVFKDCDFPTKAELDLTTPSSIADYLHNKKYQFIIHAGALTGVSRCEKNKELAWVTNVIGTKILMLETPADIPFIYISTACVFDGTKSGAYTENDIPHPKNFYALTKLLGEEISLMHQKGIVVRTNFIAKKKYPHPKAFSDRHSTYLFAHDIAHALKYLISNQKEFGKKVHICGNKQISMHSLARMCPDSKDVQPMTASQHGDAYLLTMNMDLATTSDFPSLTIDKVGEQLGQQKKNLSTHSNKG